MDFSAFAVPNKLESVHLELYGTLTDDISAFAKFSELSQLTSVFIGYSNSQGQPLQDLNPLSVFAASRELAQAEFNVAQTDLNYTYLMAYNQILNENS